MSNEAQNKYGYQLQNITHCTTYVGGQFTTAQDCPDLSGPVPDVVDDPQDDHLPFVDDEDDEGDEAEGAAAGHSRGNAQFSSCQSVCDER